MLERLQAGETEQLLDDLLDLYGQEILQLVYSYVKNRAIAEDLTQEIFVKCYQALSTYKQQSKMRTWLWRISINHCKDFLKSWYHRHVEPSLENWEVMDGTNVEEKIIQRDEDQELAHAVMRLPIIYREVIYLYYFQELSIKEIFEITGVKESTVKTRLRKAKQILRIELEGLGWKID